MHVLLYGPFGQYPKDIENQIKSLGLTIVDRNPASPAGRPDAVITYGGDGTLLGAEAAYPGIPKLPLRNSEKCFHCSSLPNDQILSRFVRGQVKTVTYSKLEATFDQKKFLALNEFCFRNKLPTAALRFTVTVNRELVYREPLIGDGIVIATPFGSTGYFYSITRESFPRGIGLALNNIHNFQRRSLILNENSEIKVEIIRGPAHFSHDNSQEILELEAGETVTIKKAKLSAKILVPTS